jgi:hypothetical protein
MEEEEEVVDLYGDTKKVEKGEETSHQDGRAAHQGDALYDEIMYEESNDKTEQEAWIKKDVYSETDSRVDLNDVTHHVRMQLMTTQTGYHMAFGGLTCDHKS